MLLRDYFFAPIYELWGLAYVPDFSQILFDRDFYSEIGIYTVLTALIGVLFYYYFLCLIWQKKFSKKRYWFLVACICALLGYIMMTIQADSFFSSIPVIPYNTAALSQLSFINAIFVIVLFYILSFVRKIIRIGGGTNKPH